MSEKILGFYKKDWLGVKIGISPKTDARKDLNKLETKQIPVRLASESVDIEWLPCILADYYDWLEGVKGQTYVVKKGDEKFPPRIKTALMFLRGTKFWSEKEAKKK